MSSQKHKAGLVDIPYKALKENMIEEKKLQHGCLFLQMNPWLHNQDVIYVGFERFLLRSVFELFLL